MSEEPPAPPPSWPPPPPPPPPPAEPPVYQPPAPPAYPPYGQGAAPWTPPTAPVQRRGPGLAVILAAVTSVAVLLLAVGGYAIVGFTTASNRVSKANSAVDSALSHHVDFRAQMLGVWDGLDAVNNNSFNTSQYGGTVDRFTAAVNADAQTSRQDSSQLDTARSALGDAVWLTALSRGSVDQASRRVGHALDAMASAGTITSNLIADSQFMKALALVLSDLDGAGMQAVAGNAAGYAAALTKVGDDLNQAATADSAPGLPNDCRLLISAFRAYTTDLIDIFNATTKAASDAAHAKGLVDVKTLAAINGASIITAIDNFYAPLLSTYEGDLRLAAG